METLSVRQLNRATLARQLLLERAHLQPVAAVARILGLQAQEPRPPFVALWTRLNDFDAPAFADAFRRGDVVRATLMRATLHAFTKDDYAAFRPALQPGIAEGLRVVGDRAKGIEPQQLAKLARTLLADEPRTFDEIRAAIAEEHPDLDHRVAGYAVRLNLPLTMVPTDDRWAFPRTAKFALADLEIETPVQPHALVRRYLEAFGPAAATDVQRWSGLKGLRFVLEGMKDDLVTFKDERGRTLYDLPDAPRPDPDTEAPPRFLPDFDQMLLAHDDKTRVIADAHRPTVVTKNLRIKAVVLVDGFAVGTWAITRTKKAATLTITPFDGLKRGTKKPLTEEGERLLAFAEPEATAAKVVVES
jgi:hypothetical protein